MITGSSLKSVQKSIDALVANLESIRDDLQGEYDDMNEKQQESEKGIRISASIDYLQEAIDAAENANASLRG